MVKRGESKKEHRNTRTVIITSWSWGTRIAINKREWIQIRHRRRRENLFLYQIAGVEGATATVTAIVTVTVTAIAAASIITNMSDRWLIII